MYNRYQGNSGRVVRVKEEHDNAPLRPAPGGRASSPLPPQPVPQEKSPVRFPSFLDGGIGRLISGSIAGLETEDIILLLILYLMYRESGDSELLIIMGAMFLL